MNIVKVFNNSVVLAVEHDGSPLVLLGRGVGFGAKAGDVVNESAVERRFVPGPSESSERLAAYLQEIPPEDIDLAARVLEVVREVLGSELNHHVLLPMADHLSFALKRAQEGVRIDYPLQWEIQALYPEEVRAARAGLSLVKQSTGVELPDVEAIPLALHLVNGQFGSGDMERTVEVTEAMSVVLDTVQEKLGVTFDSSSVAVSRFLTHLRFAFLRRHHPRAVEVSHALEDAVRRAQPIEYGVAEQVAAMLKKRYGWSVRNDDVVYLAVHLSRLIADTASGHQRAADTPAARPTEQ